MTTTDPKATLRTQFQSHATSYATGYPQISSLPLSPPEKTGKTLSHLSHHFLPYLIAFTFGTASKPLSASTRAYISAYYSSNLNLNLSIAKERLDVVSAWAEGAEVLGSGIWFVTWRIAPEDGKGEGWEWENVYGLGARRVEGTVMVGFEWTMSDNETIALRANRPALFGELTKAWADGA